MKIQIPIIVFLISLSVCFLILPESAMSSAWNFNFDLKYERTEKDEADPNITQPNVTDEIQHEYQIRYNLPISYETKLESELNLKFEQENQKGSDSSGIRDIDNYEHQEMFRIKSRLYEVRLGYKELENEADTISKTKEGFFDCKLQPEYLPEFNIKYDFERDKDPSEPQRDRHKFSINSFYNFKNFLRVRLSYLGEINDYSRGLDDNKTGQDTKEGDLLGQITFKHLLLQQKLRFDLDYKVEKEREKEIDPNDGSSWIWAQDKLSKTATSKVTYYITSDTTLTTHYENKAIDDKTDGGEEMNTFWVNMTQEVWNHVRLIGKYKYERSCQEDAEDSITDTYEAEVTANPRKWLNLQGRINLESERLDNDQKGDSQTIEGTWKSDFQHFFNARNTFNTKFVKEKDNGADSGQNELSEEEYYKWKLQLVPFTNFTLTPEYNFSKEDSVRVRDKTREFKNQISYKLKFTNQLVINLSHTISRKKTEGMESDPSSQIWHNYKVQDNNDDIKIDLKFTPTTNFILSSQLVREITKTTNRRLSEPFTKDEENTSYSLNYDWRFEPFTWSSSIKYDDHQYHESDSLQSGTDTMIFESRLAYKIKNYDLTANYRYTKNYSETPDKEERVGLQLRAHY